MAPHPRHNITLMVGTANLGNLPPDQSSLAAWVPSDGMTASIITSVSSGTEKVNEEVLELIVLGFQEGTFEGPDTGTALLHEMLEKHLPSYQHIVKFQRGEMRLEIFVHESVAKHVQVLHTAAQNTGLAGLPNKGGIIAELSFFNNTKLSFTTCHLEAHEGTVKYNIRCATMCDIFQGTRPAGVLHDTTITSHFAFVLGDLNFRTELPQGRYKTEQEHHDIIHSLIRDRNWDELNRYDELKRAIRNKECLVGFETPECNFNPTFKVERSAGYKYNEKRRPSYTDRILWKSGHELTGAIKTLLYAPIEQFSTSDHKPVRGVFQVQLNETIKFRPRLHRTEHLRWRSSIFTRNQPSSHINAAGKRQRLNVFVSQIKCQLLPLQTVMFNSARRISQNNSMESLLMETSNPVVKKLPSPYVMFVANPEPCMERRKHNWFVLRSAVLGRHHVTARELDGTKVRTAMGWPRTRICKQTRDPHWEHDEVKIPINAHLHCGESVPLTGCTLNMTVMDAEGIRNLASPLIGTFSFNLANLVLKCFHANAQSKRKNEQSAPQNQDSSRAYSRSSMTRRSSVGARRRGSVFNLLGIRSHAHADENLVSVDIDESLMKNGKEVGRIQCRIEAYWEGDSSGTARAETSCSA